MQVSNSKIILDEAYHFNDLDVLQYVIDFLHDKKEAGEFDEDDSTILMKELRYNSCFVRYRDPNSFSLAFLPEYPNLQENAVEPLYQYFAVAIFECQRQQPSNPMWEGRGSNNNNGSIHDLLRSPENFEQEKVKSLPTLKLIVEDDESEIIHDTDISAFTETETQDPESREASQIISEVSEIEPSETDGLRGRVKKLKKIKNGQMIIYGYGNHQNPNTTNLPISGPTIGFTEDIQKAYSHAFIKSIYTGLIQGNSINSNDFEMVLKHCEESPIDIDITSYLDVRTLCRSWNHDTDNEFKDVTQKFAAVLNHHFKLISTEEIYGKNI
jgi:hypothetical protein